MASNTDFSTPIRTIEDRINIYFTWLSQADDYAYNCIFYAYMYTGFNIIPFVEEWEKGLQERVANRKIERAQKIPERMKNHECNEIKE